MEFPEVREDIKGDERSDIDVICSKLYYNEASHSWPRIFATVIRQKQRPANQG
jgi:hypothetical protein